MRSYTATLRYSYALSHKVSMYYAQRQFGRTTIVSVLLLVLGLGIASYNGFYLPFSEIIGLSVAGSLGFYFWYRYEIRRRWIYAMNNMGKPEAQLTVTDESFAVSSGAGSSVVPWARFTDIWKQEEYWLLFIGKYSAPITIPLTGVDPDALKLIDEKVTEARKSKTV